ncbi:MAG: (2Fe-2S)-binding protein [Planctomycetota bacterium]|jgi:bacterioferritin-associated ferredoxin|nr:MAG: (2Fe-2S)-binding protein [Planctomycetota bacterium]
MDPDDHVCLCFRVSLRKIANFVARENPRVPSQISDCLGAGTGCQWCVPFLKKLHQMHVEGKPLDLPVSPEEYAKRRAHYRKSGDRADAVDGEPPHDQELTPRPHD